MFTAFVDESMRRRPDDDNIYAMAAITLHATGHHDARLTLESLRLGKNPRLHWRDEPIARQLVIADAISKLPLAAVVAVHIYDTTCRTERARRRCLERLLLELEGAGVTEVVVESRSPSQDHLDLLFVMALRKSRVISKAIMVHWRPSHQEPLLWAADAVVSATTWWIDGHGAGFERLQERVRVVCVD
ncbi:DUF3800 domain-containing protein [Nonomuraea sp. C10]|uniref:DUF3800 domain-containing protein n=2 Tax=Nonomuraea ferruginea TaxID=46174 RepID=A0ABT4T3B0_9ACTN|nr:MULTISPECIES: DUF3800 domain-containing protein [Nonomuraea]MDA0644012.1 DUF3800 domain-containing protein [Nonomuraea ferruginea]TXK43230.1 hypothetical protein FR742_29905 [Nonomuraea sp. C10]